jgi:hypothetical protein
MDCPVVSCGGEPRFNNYEYSQGELCLFQLTPSMRLRYSIVAVL